MGASGETKSMGVNPNRKSGQAWAEKARQQVGLRLVEGQRKSTPYCVHPTYGSDTALDNLDKATGNHSGTLPKRTTMAATRNCHGCRHGSDTTRTHRVRYNVAYRIGIMGVDGDQDEDIYHFQPIFNILFPKYFVSGALPGPRWGRGAYT